MRNPNKPLQCVALLCGLAALSVNAKEIAVPKCPGKVTARQEIKLPMADGWKAVNDKGAYTLYSIFLSRGEYPAKQTELLTPDDERERLWPSSDSMISYYDNLPPDADGVRDYWMVCDYTRASVAVVKKLPQNIVRCEVRYALRPAQGEEISLRCFDKPRKKPRY
jgi:hypothetical protein